jgi:hypothetical protein
MADMSHVALEFSESKSKFRDHCVVHPTRFSVIHMDHYELTMSRDVKCFQKTECGTGTRCTMTVDDLLNALK